ncbi:MAG: hypothetical protein BWY83_03415 [bacterium ADurb.Bin478]|nr:MAG: hypothetical protein BWY83_03415 [bacterium ADurb.Bin478]
MQGAVFPLPAEINSLFAADGADRIKEHDAHVLAKGDVIRAEGDQSFRALYLRIPGRGDTQDVRALALYVAAQIIVQSLILVALGVGVHLLTRPKIDRCRLGAVVQFIAHIRVRMQHAVGDILG